MRLPPVKLDHLERLTDTNGIVQFAPLGVPDPATGYTIDDSTRALIVMARLPRSRIRERLAGIYLTSLLRAQRPDGTFAHEAYPDRSLSLTTASEDGFGRLIWACGEVAASDLPETIKHTAASVYERACPHVAAIRRVRGWSNAMQGLALWAQYTGDRWAEEATADCAERVLNRLETQSDPQWVWFEDVITYEPGRFPLGLLYAAALTADTRYLKAAERILAFLEQHLFAVTAERRIFAAAGNRGWYRRGGVRAVFDQQPVDAASLVEAATAAAVLTDDPRYHSLARDAFEWFLGDNVRGTALYDPETGACYDGLTPNGVNLNTGAESTICYLMARLTIGAKTIPISRLLAGRPRALELRDARRAESAPARQEQQWPPARPSAGPRPATLSRR
jgi:hypothetical protein